MGNGLQNKPRGAVRSGEMLVAAGRRVPPSWLTSACPPGPSLSLIPSPIFPIPVFWTFPPPIPSVPDLSDYPQIPLLLIRLSFHTGGIAACQEARCCLWWLSVSFTVA